MLACFQTRTAVGGQGMYPASAPHGYQILLSLGTVRGVPCESVYSRHSLKGKALKLPRI